MQVCQSRGVDVRKPEEASREIGRVLVRPEDGAKIRVAINLQVVSAKARGYHKIELLL